MCQGEMFGNHWLKPSYDLKGVRLALPIFVKSTCWRNHHGNQAYEEVVLCAKIISSDIYVSILHIH